MVKEKYQKTTIKTTSITLEFANTRLTNYSGLVPISDFLMEKLDFRQALAEHLDLGIGANCQYQDWQIFELIIFGYLCGYDRLAHFDPPASERDATVG